MPKAPAHAPADAPPVEVQRSRSEQQLQMSSDTLAEDLELVTKKLQEIMGGGDDRAKVCSTPFFSRSFRERW